MGKLSDMLIEKFIQQNLLMNFLEYIFCQNTKESEFEGS